MAIHAHLAEHVKSLQLLWLADGENRNTLWEVVQSCPRVQKLLIQRGRSRRETNIIDVADIKTMAAMLDICWQLSSFTYGSPVNDAHSEDHADDETERDQAADCALENPHFSVAASRLQKLTTHGQVV